MAAAAIPSFRGRSPRHRATAALSNVVVVSPNPAWIATLPNGKLPDRADFKFYGDDMAARVTAWSHALRMSEQLRESYAGLERKVEARTAELSEALQRQTATADILRVISGSITDAQPVFDAIVQSGHRLFGEGRVAQDIV